MAVNIANLKEQWSIFQMVRELFPKTTVSIHLDASSNFIILAVNDESFGDFLSHLKSSVKGLSWDAKWGVMAKI